MSAEIISLAVPESAANVAASQVMAPVQCQKTTKDNKMSEKLKKKMFCSRCMAVGIIQRQGRVRTDLEKSWKMTLVLENSWNSKKNAICP